MVAPLAGAWIEIMMNLILRLQKYVAPLAGAWIEIIVGGYGRIGLYGRSPRGSVD